MIGLRKTLAQTRGAATIQATNRGFAGGGAKPKPIDPRTTDFDIVFVGKKHFFSQAITRTLTLLLYLI